MNSFCYCSSKALWWMKWAFVFLSVVSWEKNLCSWMEKYYAFLNIFSYECKLFFFISRWAEREMERTFCYSLVCLSDFSICFCSLAIGLEKQLLAFGTLYPFKFAAKLPLNPTETSLPLVWMRVFSCILSRTWFPFHLLKAAIAVQEEGTVAFLISTLYGGRACTQELPKNS